MRGEMVDIFLHVAAVAPFICLFLLGKLAIEACGELAAARRRMLVAEQHVCKYFP
jgi:hypothetical protein